MGACNICGESDAAAAARNTEANKSRYGSDDEVGSKSISSVDDEFLAGSTRNGYDDPQFADPTVDGQINWIKMAEFSAMLPSHVKRKLWNGVFKAEAGFEMSEPDKIKRILKVFVMLFLTRIFKKNQQAVPQEVKDRLPNALEYPSRFMAAFLKQDAREMARKLSTVHMMLAAKSQRGAGRPGAKKEKYVKLAKSIEDNFAELASETPRSPFSEKDFVRPAFLQYLICAFCYETQEWRQQIPFDERWAKNQMKGSSDEVLVRGYLRGNSGVLQIDGEPFSALTLFYYHNLYIVQS